LAYDEVETRMDPATGEIQMRCPALMKAYYREPELTATALTPDGWLRTGDKGVMDSHGFLSITGRVKDLFKTSKGKYIAPAPIEDKLVAHDAVEACVVTGAHYAQPFALVMLSPDAAAESRSTAGRQALEAALQQHLQLVNSHLEPHEKLDFLIAVAETWTSENGLVTPTLKVKRTSIEAKYAPSYDRWLNQHREVVWADQPS
jgi:long-chain acyl-CoA synthetase